MCTFIAPNFIDNILIPRHEKTSLLLLPCTIVQRPTNTYLSYRAKSDVLKPRPFLQERQSNRPKRLKLTSSNYDLQYTCLRAYN
jgi:hypothetical protein